MRNKLRRPLAFLLSAVMVVTMSGTPVHAAADSGQPETGLCEHHTAHTDDCGYKEETPGTPCGHEHTEDCYTKVTECVHEHTSECYQPETEDSVSGSEATPADAKEREPENCPHICDGESGCVTEKLDCRHEHDSECGYTESTPGTPCTFVCEICNPQDSGEADKEAKTGIIKQEQCSCLTLCTEGQINPDCPVCGGLGAGLSDCRGKTMEENPEQSEDTGICKHHQEHDDTCGYQPASEDEEGSPCTYDCRICPIEDLIAALPDRVTEDNAEDIRAQLDKILDLYRELTGEEQEQIDISFCLELQEALDAANAHAQVDTFSGLTIDTVGGSVTQDENKQIVLSGGGTYTISGTWTNELDGAASASPKYAILVKTDGTYNITLSNTTIETPYNYEGAFSIEAGASVNLTLTGENKLASGVYCAGLHVPQGASLTIGGDGKLSSTGGYAGIGGGEDETNGAITIRSGAIEASSKNGAGIGGGYMYREDIRNIVGDEIRIEGGTITAAGGRASAGIGGGYCGVNAPITITGGTVRATGGESGAGIGSGGGSSSINSASDIVICGTARVTADGEYGAGIGGGRLVAAGNITIDGSADVTANGIGHGVGNRSAKSGTLVVSGSARIESTGGIEIGNFTCSDSPWINSTGIQVNSKDSRNGGIVFDGNAGTVYGSQTIKKDYELASGMTLEVPSGASLTIPFGVNLTGSGTLTGQGKFITENLTEDMISIPDIHYTSEDMTEDIKGKVTISGKNICSQTFMADMDNWTLSVTKVSDMEYTVTYTHESKAKVSKTVIILPCLHGNGLDALTHHDKVEADCTQTGSVEYWDCSVCKKNFSDQNGQTELEDTVIPIADHTLTYHEKVEADCTNAGVKEYWDCSVCAKKFSDEGGQTEIADADIVIPMESHKLTRHAEVEADCTNVGVKEYWDCSVCAKKFSDEGGQTEIADADIVIPMESHKLTHHAEVEAGCLTEGNMEYWSCDVCGKLFSDSDGKQEVTDAKISAKGHEYGAWESTGNGTHTHSCQRSGCDSTETENCTGGTATYTETAKCEVCGGGYGEPLEDAGAPTGEISINTNHWSSFLHTITFGLFFKETEQVTITAQDNESGVASVSYYISDSELTEEDVKKLDNWTAGNTDKTTFSISPDKSCVVYVKITDKQGNVTYISSDGLVFDGTPPSIIGVTDKGTYCTPQTVTVTDDNLKSVTVNGKEQILSDGKFILGAASGVQTIKAADKAGNVTTVTVTVNAGHDHGTEWKSDGSSHWHECACGDKADTAAHIKDGGSITKPATETEAGIRTFKCSVCGYMMQEEAIGVLSPSHTHSYGTEWKSDAGSHWYECSCGNKSGLASHTEDGGSVTKAPTETETGVMTFKCWVCGHEIRTEDIGKLPSSHTHSYSTGWKSDGSNHWHECICGDKADTAAHTEDGGTVTKPATEKETGITTYKCSVCGCTMRAEGIEALPHTHSYGTEWESDSNSHWHECACGDRSGVSAHTEDGGNVTKEPTEKETGVRTYRCSICGCVMRTEEIGIKPADNNNGVGGSGGSGSTGSTGGGGSTGSSSSTGTAPKQPFIKDNAGRKGWDVIRAEAEKAAAAQAGGTVAVDMNGTVSVPGSIFAAVREKDVTLCFDMGSGITWSVNGKDITAETAGDTDFSVKADAGAIPEGLIAETAGGLAHLELSLAHEGAFGFTATLTVRIASRDGNGITVSGSGTAAGYTGMYANLFYYDPALRSLEFICAGQISEDGTADLPFVHASDYTVILSAYPMGGTGTPGTPQEPGETEKPQGPEKQAGVKSVKLSKTLYTYNGKAKKPAVIAIDTEGRKIPGRYYTVSYKNNKKAGKATATVRFKGGCSGTVKKTFTIRPAGTSIKKLTAASGGFTVKWKKKTAQTSGYQIQYSANAGFKGSSTRSVFVKKNSKAQKTVKNLKAGKKYYVRIRTYKTVKADGKNTKVYSAWSSPARVRTLPASGGKKAAYSARAGDFIAAEREDGRKRET